MAKAFLTKRWLINYVLFVLIVVFTVIGNRYNVQTGYQPENPISALKPRDIDRVSIQSADSIIDLRKTVSQWFIESPLKWPANNVSVERLLGLATSSTDSRLPSKEIDLATLGLQFPRAILTLNDTQFLFGDTNNIGERRYVLSDATVFLLPDNYFPFFIQGPGGLLDRRLLPRSIQLRRLKISPFDLTQTTTGSWQDANSTTDSSQLSGLVNNWQTLEAASIKPYDSNASPRQKVVATIADNIDIEFFVLAIQPEIVIARPDLGYQYHFNQKLYYELLALAENDAAAN